MNYLKFGISRKKGKSFMGQNFNAFLAAVILTGTSTLLHNTAGAATADEIEDICNERYYSADPRSYVRRQQPLLPSASRSAPSKSKRSFYDKLVRGITPLFERSLEANNNYQIRSHQVEAPKKAPPATPIQRGSICSSAS